MAHGPDAANRQAHRLRVAQVALLPLRARRQVGIVAVVRRRMQGVEDADVGARREQRFGDVRADESGAAGDEDRSAHRAHRTKCGLEAARSDPVFRKRSLCAAMAAGKVQSMHDVVLPVLNEAGAIPWVLERLPVGFRAIVVDNGSDDGSAELAASFGATVVIESQRGFGAACHAGLQAATADVVCFMDCDASLDPGDLPAVAEPVALGDFDLVLGRRRVQGRGAWPLHARLGNRAIATSLRRRTGLALRDLGPMRAARRTDLLELKLADRRFGYPLEMVLRAADAGWRVLEVDVPYHPRIGRSKVTGSVRGTVLAIRDMRGVLT